jgi:4-amino-4-deoxy-L-arabinose transferase-like glycosyltransferase
VSTALRSRLVVVGLLVATFALALTSAVQKSPTMDEQNHVARGAAYLGTGDPRLSVEHPPLVNVLSALPAHLLLDLHLPLDTVFWKDGAWYQFADLFLWEANPNAEQIIFLARLPIIGLGLVLVSLVYRWAESRWGPWGGLLSAAFCALDPNVLAHTRLSTTDVGGACFAFLAAYALWRAVRHPSWLRILGSGLAFGLALSAKLSNLLFGPIFALAILAAVLAGALVGRHGNPPYSRGGGRLGRAMRNLALLALTVLLGLLTVWAAYGFQIGRLEGNGPLVPASPYLEGVRAILDFSAGGRPAYLLGQYGPGWWYYFPVALAVKTPLATLVALLLATEQRLRCSRQALRRSRQAPATPAAPADDLLLLIPPVAYFLASMASSLNIGYRHLLPVLPFVAVHVGRLVSSPGLLVSLSPRLLIRRLLPIALIVWLMLNTLLIYPHFLAFFNAVGGGPQNGWRILADSNIDWGQDLKGLEAWIAREGVDHVRLSWFGSAHPEAYNIPYDLLPGVPHGFSMWERPPFDRDQPEPGIYVISVTNLLGVHFPDRDLYAWFRARPPDAKIGYSLFVYEVSADG